MLILPMHTGKITMNNPWWCNSNNLFDPWPILVLNTIRTIQSIRIHLNKSQQIHEILYNTSISSICTNAAWIGGCSGSSGRCILHYSLRLDWSVTAAWILQPDWCALQSSAYNCCKVQVAGIFARVYMHAHQFYCRHCAWRDSILWQIIAQHNLGPPIGAAYAAIWPVKSWCACWLALFWVRACQAAAARVRPGLPLA